MEVKNEYTILDLFGIYCYYYLQPSTTILVVALLILLVFLGGSIIWIWIYTTVYYYRWCICVQKAFYGNNTLQVRIEWIYYSMCRQWRSANNNESCPLYDLFDLFRSSQLCFRKFWRSSKNLTQNVLPYSRLTLKAQSRKFLVPSRTGKCSLVNLWTQKVPLLTWTTVKTVWRHMSGSLSTDSNKKRSKPPDLGSDNIHSEEIRKPT